MTEDLRSRRKRNRIARARGRRPRALTVTAAPAPPPAQGQCVPAPDALDRALVAFCMASVPRLIDAGVFEIVDGELRLRKAT